MNNHDWIKFHNNIKKYYLNIAPQLWWGDDLDVRFYLLKQLQNIRNNNILDIGCNVGVTLSFLDKTVEKYGIDIDKNCIEKAKKLNPEGKLLTCSMLELPFKDRYFDTVIMMNVLPTFDFNFETNDDRDAIITVLNEALRVLHKNGCIYLTTPNGESLPYANKGKITYNQLTEYLNQLDNIKYNIWGWNNFYENSIFSKVSTLPVFKYLTHPKILCKNNAIWEKLKNSMDIDIKKSKYFYVIIKKIN